ncbi:hypothetical protein EPD65_11380, partial [Nocardioides jejuensis]
MCLGLCRTGRVSGLAVDGRFADRQRLLRAVGRARRGAAAAIGGRGAAVRRSRGGAAGSGGAAVGGARRDRVGRAVDGDGSVGDGVVDAVDGH